MKVKYISDLHLEFGPLKEEPLADADVLVLAGDICIKNRVHWINDQADRFKHVIYITGNHEYYKSNISNMDDKLIVALDPRIHFLQNSSVKIEDTWFHGATLWTDGGDPLNEYAIDRGMNDFRLIRRGENYDAFKCRHAKRLHDETMAYLQKNVKEGDVVVTHHAPSFESSLECFKGDSLNGAYATDLSEFIMDHKPSFWIHGHMHNTSDYKIAGTNVLCNPRGYVHEENFDFDVNKTFEV